MYFLVALPRGAGKSISDLSVEASFPNGPFTPVPKSLQSHLFNACGGEGAKQG